MGKEPSGNHNFIRQPLGGFLKNLGSDSVSPGGGGAAALTGALGTALVEMVTRINQKRKPSADFRKKIARLEKARARFGELMRLDTEAFLNLTKFPKEKRQSARYQNALKRAAGVPFEICALAVEALEIGQSEVDRTSRWLASDLVESGILLEASFRSGRLNAEINLRSIENRLFLRKTKSRLNLLEKKAATLNKNLSQVLNP